MRDSSMRSGCLDVSATLLVELMNSRAVDARAEYIEEDVFLID